MKAFLYKFRIPLLEWYFVASCCYFIMLGTDGSVWITALAIGFVNTYIVTPIVFAVSDITKDEIDAYYGKKSPTFKNVAKSFLLCGGILGIYFLVNLYLFETAVDAYSFGILYYLLDKTMGKIFKKWHNYSITSEQSKNTP